jgi:RNA polymerase sigma-70 factor (ECF subfamily)
MPATPESLYEQTLVLRSQLGDEAAFTELLKLHGPRILLFVRRMLQSLPDSTADVVQDTWLAIYRGLPGLLDVSKFRAWAFRIARDRVYREYRRRKYPVQSLEDTPLAALSDAEETAPGLDLAELGECLAQLPLPQREVLVLRFFEELSYAEIARATDCTVGTVRSRIHYGKLALKKFWKERAII